MEGKMKPVTASLGVDRRALLAAPALLSLPALLRVSSAFGQDSSAQLPSWNGGAAKQAIVDFVKATTDSASPKFVPPEERIATFDQDGTLWVEHPIYSFVMYALDRVPAVVKAKPQLAKVEPFKTVLTGDREAIAKLSLRDLEKIIAATFTCRSMSSAPKLRSGSKPPRMRVGSGHTPSSPTSR